MLRCSALGEERTSVCVIDDLGTPLHEQACQTSPEDIECSLSTFALAQIEMIAVEAGGVGHLVRKLRARGYPVQMFETRKANKFLAIRRSKTDASDARGLADLARLGQRTVSKVHLTSVEFQDLRSELMLREQLIRVRVSAELGIRSRLASVGRRLRISTAVGALRRDVETELAILKVEEGIDLSGQLGPLIDVAEILREYVRGMDRALHKRARENAVCSLLMEIPGVGPLCALSFYAAVEDPNRFGHPADVGAYFGLIPRRHQSGEISYSLGITKTGSKLVRKNLVMAVLMMRTRNIDCALRDWHISLRDRIGPGRAKVAAARKLAVLMLTMWKSGTHFRPYPEKLSADVDAAAVGPEQPVSTGLAELRPGGLSSS